MKKGASAPFFMRCEPSVGILRGSPPAQIAKASMVLTRGQRFAAIALSLALAIPMVTLVSSLVVLLMLAFAALGIFANAGPVLLLAAAGLRRAGLNLGTSRLLEKWQFCVVLWIGCAYGLPNWGDAGSTIGAQPSLSQGAVRALSLPVRAGVS
jgi:hypothetical protein